MTPGTKEFQSKTCPTIMKYDEMMKSRFRQTPVDHISLQSPAAFPGTRQPPSDIHPHNISRARSTVGPSPSGLGKYRQLEHHPTRSHPAGPVSLAREGTAGCQSGDPGIVDSGRGSLDVCAPLPRELRPPTCCAVAACGNNFVLIQNPESPIGRALSSCLLVSSLFSVQNAVVM